MDRFRSAPTGALHELACLPRVVMVGGGHMGLAIVQGLHRVAPELEILVVDTDAERRAALSVMGDLNVAADLDIAESDVVVLAIPPQAFAQFAEAQRHQFGPHVLVVSVMAGLTAAAITKALGTWQVVRAIPNTPSEVYAGMTVYYADGAVGEAAVAMADLLLRSIGRVLRVESEELVDDATAICGGGPAFVSYIVDAFCSFAVSCGFTSQASREMAVQVFGGTAALIAHSEKPPMQLCREVMTPNGTTERGIAVFDSVGLQNSIHQALSASARRSREFATP